MNTAATACYWILFTFSNDTLPDLLCLRSFGLIPRRPDGGRNIRLFDYHCNGRETQIAYCTGSTSACTCSTVDSSSIGVICGNYTYEGQGDVVG